MIKQAEEVKEGAFAAAGRARDRVEKSLTQRDVEPAQNMYTGISRTQMAMQVFGAKDGGVVGHG